MKKRIGIITHPLLINYGGLLQAYALQEVLRRMGHDPRTVDVTVTSRHRYKELLKPLLLPLLSAIFPGRYTSSSHRDRFRRRHTERFVRDNIRLTVPVKTRADAEALAAYRFDVCIVGSDQCWRAAQISDPWMHFLGFVPGDAATRRIAYAVSLGTDVWDYDPRQTALCKELAGRFDAISVRESSGVTLCREHLGVEAAHLLDPTMLLSADDYLKLADDDGIASAAPVVTSYILDPTPAKLAMADAAAARFGLPVRRLTIRYEHDDPEFSRLYAGAHIPVTQWLRSFADARFVVTDSFHGAVFAIIFNKPFLAVGNATRGMARFASLLGMFGLEDRLVGPDTAITIELLARHIDYTRVNAIIARERKKAAEFLTAAIG